MPLVTRINAAPVWWEIITLIMQGSSWRGFNANEFSTSIIRYLIKSYKCQRKYSQKVISVPSKFILQQQEKKKLRQCHGYAVHMVFSKHSS